MTLPVEDIARIDREFLRGQERDRMNERTGAIWPIFLSLTSGFGFIALQGNNVAYLAALYPVLINCLALHIRNGEETLKHLRKFLYQQEQALHYEDGYEHFARNSPRRSHGGYKKALREAFTLSQVLALGLVVAHLVQDHVLFLIILVVAGVEIAATITTWNRLSDRALLASIISVWRCLAERMSRGERQS